MFTNIARRFLRSATHLRAYRFCSAPPAEVDGVVSMQDQGTLSFQLQYKGQEVTGTKHGSELLMTVFTCGPCGNRMARTFTKQAYEKGVVLIRCDSCQNIHLMADNLGWFEDERWNVENNAQGKRITSPNVKAMIDELVSTWKQ